jgi:hypothetical protein
MNQGIDYKSTATLLNELITTRLKIKNMGEKPAFLERQDDLVEAITDRYSWEDIEGRVGGYYDELREVSSKLWWEQEILYQYQKKRPENAHHFVECAYAGINSLELNAERSRLVRAIDEVLGELSSTPLEKSWK